MEHQRLSLFSLSLSLSRSHPPPSPPLPPLTFLEYSFIFVYVFVTCCCMRMNTCCNIHVVVRGNMSVFTWVPGIQTQAVRLVLQALLPTMASPGPHSGFPLLI